jgi:hypothetical protein
MECGDMKCTSDDQCVTGLPDYECDQSTDPSKNQCKKICNVGERGTADCPCSPNTHKGPKITCGAIDVDGDGQLTAIDLAAFALDYNSVCTDTAPTTGCEGKDTNKDKMVDYVDLASFATRYHTVAASCVPK